MSMRISAIAAICLISLGLAACETNQYGKKQSAGAVIGSIAGGILGAQVGKGSGKAAAAAAGAVLGLYLGSEVGKTLDRADKLYASQTANRAFESNPVGQSSGWKNPDSGNSGSFTPTRTVLQSNGEPCRDYETTVTIDGRTETAYGRACRSADGSWRIVN
jgi:surface antigen